MQYSNDSLVDAGEPIGGAASEAGEEMQISEERLQLLGASLAERRDEWVSAKQASGIEKRWLDDYDQYMGRDDASRQVASMMDSAQAGFPVMNKGALPQRSTVFINITRPKTNTAEARVANMLLPTDDRNFGIKPSPSPELSKASEAVMAQASQQGSPAPAFPAQPVGAQVQAGMPAAPAPNPAQGIMQNPAAAAQIDPQAILDMADRAAKAMQTEVDSQLQNCNYNGECRAMIHDAAVLGTGVLKGPIVARKTTKTWVPMSDGLKTVHVLEIDSETVPESYKISPWNCYPDPSCGADIRNGSGMFEVYSYTSKQVRELVKQPGFLEAQIAKVLEQGPDAGGLKNELEKRDQQKKETYKVWEYWGEFEPEDLRASGVDIEDGATGLISGCIILINDVVIKGFLNPLDTGEIPYDFFPWEADAESPWGYGVPYLCRSAQRVLNAAWRQLMDNSGNTMGPQIILKPGIIEPVDGQWTITGNKLWNCLDDSLDVRNAFVSIDIANHSAELENIIKLAQSFADEESMVPQMVSGEHGNAPDTVGGMTILVNSNNVVLGRIAKQYDDRVTTPHIGRYVDWNMAYSEKAEIKGDHNVQARGTSALLVRDIQNQTLIQFGQFQSSGVISPMVNWEAWIKAVLKAQHVDPTEILKTDAEIAALQNQPPQPTPDQIKAQNAMQLVQAKGQVDQQLLQAKFQGEMQAEQQSLQLDQQRLQNGELTPHAANATARIQAAQISAASKAQIEQSRAASEQAYAQTEAQMAHDNQVADLQKLQLQRDLAMLNYAQQHQLSLDQIRADLAKTSMQEQTKRQLAAAELQLKANEGNANRLHESISSQPEQPIE